MHICCMTIIYNSEENENLSSSPFQLANLLHSCYLGKSARAEGGKLVHSEVF